MSNLTQLRLNARAIFFEALEAVDAGDAIRRVTAHKGDELLIAGASVDLRQRGVYSIAIGKAAAAMSIALEERLGARLIGGVIAGPSRSEVSKSAAAKRSACQYFEGGHPWPNDASLLAAQAALSLLERANQEGASVVFLISGGGSAMFELPINEDISLADIDTANRILVSSGASISEINAVRRSFSAVKGGRLAELASNCDQFTLIISDVPWGEEWNVASGPTLSPPGHAPQAREVVERYQLRSRLPSAVLRALDADTAQLKFPAAASSRLRDCSVLLSNDDALDAAATASRHRGFAVEIAEDISDEPIESGCEKLVQRLSEPVETPGKDLCLISGGEFSCPVRGNGLGGRNLETALRLAIEYAKSVYNRPFVALCAGTDGIDGNSPAAGAIIDNTTIERAHKIGLDPQDFLNRSDAYSFFVALGDAITTGPTGTNVRDLRILLQSA
jgi:glycerate 2-kinase